jgi:GNAT superfamily N-acetyltransferase
MEPIIRKCEEVDYEKAPYNKAGKQELLKKAVFSDRKLFCFVIECDERMAGYFSYTFDFSTWDAKTFLYLDCLYLEPEFRGHRIGEIVFGKLKEIAKQNNCINIQWQTPNCNERAIKFYNRIGGTGKHKRRFFLDMKYWPQEAI